MKRLMVLWLYLTVTACANKQGPSKSEYNQPQPNGTTQAKQGLVKNKLQAQYTQWRGSPYLLGGLNKQGIDCSGFVYLTFKQQFNHILPRTTKHQKNIGQKLSASQLRAGDLVFFKMAKHKRHVGIYMENGNFMHASTSQGVTISNLSEAYWQKYYWFSSRPLL